MIAIQSESDAVDRWIERAGVGSMEPAAIVPPPLECNYGGPMSRSRELRLRSTILGDGVDHVSCPLVRSIALDFGGADPVAYVRGLMEALGYASPEAARGEFLPVLQRCVCCVSRKIVPDRIDTLAPEVVLERALILGLSTRSIFDPARPVIWTRASLLRRLNLYEVAGFYA
jgi:hypothetical protein